ncbi:hypothetical protein ACET3X_002150 [Alternaria dauci]|uniref:Tyrosinase copper-binding domain-containing protein n=1 Tax=Alternaria dauci TaxID=48095 RepID=A0ABR3UNT3_9PLEO
MQQADHAAAPFFPWHRIYLHLFEEQLKKRCGYQGSLPYWDWTLDNPDIHNAPVWDNFTGFGGNGGGVTGTALPNATCVSDGPLSSMKPLYFNAKRMPHCLSRAFVHLDAEGVYAQALGPEAWLKILNQTDYDSFRRDMDDTVHNTIHGAVGGDFLDINSSNDPIFYLHHAQLDRLWWIWQKQRTHRAFEYRGLRSETSNMSASLDDELNFMYLHRGVPVSDAMSTESGMLCYQY